MAVITNCAQQLARLVDMFGAGSWPEAMQQLPDQGPGTLLKLIRELEATDPTGTRWKRSKAQDDATIAYIRC